MTAPVATRPEQRLPKPPPGKLGWPWTRPVWPELPRPDQGIEWPRLSVVTPSFNQGKYLEETIRSVLLQGYPNLEYTIIDGGSTDESVDIIRRYADHLHYWVSEPDRGQFHAINKGFEHTTGAVMAYLNSDDMYLPWSFGTVGQIFAALPAVEWLTTQTNLEWGSTGALTAATHGTRHARTWFYRGQTLGGRRGAKTWIQQEATFWRRSLWERTGGRMDEGLHLAGDFELWARFFQRADLVTVSVPLSGWRRHTSNKSVVGSYYAEADRVLAGYSTGMIRQPWAVWALELIHGWTRWGRRFGSRATWVEHNNRTRQWELKSAPVI